MAQADSGGERSPRDLSVKIAILIHELENQGGGERQCVALARELHRSGHIVTLYTSAYDGSCYEKICSELHVQVTGRGWFPNFRRSAYLRRFLDMRRMASFINEPHDIWNPHHWPPHWASVWLKRRFGGHIVWMCNDVPDFKQKYDAARPVHSAASRLKALIYKWMWKYDARQIRGVDLTLVLSQWTKTQLLDVYKARVSVIRSGMDQYLHNVGDSEKIRRRFGFTQSDFVVLWFGIFMPHRRLEDAITATARLRERGIQIRLLLAGSQLAFPDYAEHLKLLAARLNVQDAVTFAGTVAEHEVADYYAAADVFLFPNTNQTWGLVVIEAMAAGKPVIVSTGSGVHEVIEDNKTGLKVPPCDPDAIANKLELLFRDPSLRIALASFGKNYCLERFSWERYAQDMVAAFERTRGDAETQSAGGPPVANELATAGQ